MSPRSEGEVQGTFAEKLKTCMWCEFYVQFDLKHRARMRKKFGRLLHT